MELIKEPWPWYVAGPMIAVVMFVMLYFGKNFGMSANLRTMCAIGGAGKYAEFFNFDWRSQVWNLVFVLGTITGGYLASEYLSNGHPLQLSEAIVSELNALGVDTQGGGILPESLFGVDALFSLRGIVMMVFGGFLVGFGARYAGGCTSGHAISGLSDLQVPSLIAVVGFFIGGLLMTFFLLPIILRL